MEKGIFLFAFAFVLLSSGVFAASLNIYPDATGNYVSWGSSGCSSSYTWRWTCVDEVIANTTDYVASANNGNKISFNFSNTGLSNQTIRAVDLHYYSKRYSSSSYYFKPLIKASGEHIGSNIYNYASYSDNVVSYLNNPLTGNAWSVSEVDSLQAGMALNGSNQGAVVAQVYAEVDYDNPATPADLIINSTSFTEYSIFSNDTNTSQVWVSVNSTIGNIGGNSAIAFTNSHQGINYTSSTNVTYLLKPGKTAYLNDWYLCSGPHTYSITTDTLNVVTEANETNNFGLRYIDCIL
jgi:hypothetical protein